MDTRSTTSPQLNKREERDRTTTGEGTTTIWEYRYSTSILVLDFGLTITTKEKKIREDQQ